MAETESTTSEYNLTNFRLAEPYLTLPKDERAFEGVAKPAYKLNIHPDGEAKSRTFSCMLHGAEFSRIVKDRWGKEMMFASWGEDNPALADVKAFDEWVYNYFKTKIFAVRESRIGMGYTDAKDANLPIKHFLTFDEKRKVWSMILRPTMSGGVSKNGKKFSATSCTLRKTKKEYPVKNFTKIGGSGIIGRMGIELSGNQKEKRFYIHIYSLLYNQIRDASSDNMGGQLDAADRLDPMENDELDETEAALLEGPFDDDETGGLHAEREEEPENEALSVAAPAPDAPVISATRPTITSVPTPAKTLRK